MNTIKYENEFATFEIRNDILYTEFKDQVSLTLVVARQVVADQVILLNGKSCPVLLDMRKLVDSEKGGRDFLASTTSIPADAMALLAEGKISLAISEFYLKVSKPAVPTAIFRSKTAALHYLKKTHNNIL